MNRFDQDWQKLVALARQAPRDDGGAVPPPGFATRVAALSARPVSSPWLGFEGLALRGFVAAAVCCMAVLAYSYFGQARDLAEESAMDDTVSELLALS